MVAGGEFMDSEAMKRAKKKYRDSHSAIQIVISDDLKESMKSRAQALGLSLTAYIVSLVNADLAGVPADLSGIPADSADQTEG